MYMKIVVLIFYYQVYLLINYFNIQLFLFFDTYFQFFINISRISLFSWVFKFSFSIYFVNPYLTLSFFNAKRFNSLFLKANWERKSIPSLKEL